IKTLEYYNAARSLYHRAKNLREEAATLVSIGGIKADMGESQQALDAFIDAAILYKETGDEDKLSDALSSVRQLRSYFSWSDAGRREGLASRLRLLPVYHGNATYRGDEVNALELIGQIYFSWKEKEKALEYYLSALKLYENDVYALKVTGDIYLQLNDKERALSYYLQ